MSASLIDSTVTSSTFKYFSAALFIMFILSVLLLVCAEELTISVKNSVLFITIASLVCLHWFTSF